MPTIDGSKVDETDEQRRIRLGLLAPGDAVPDAPDNDRVVYKHDPIAQKVVAKNRESGVKVNSNPSGLQKAVDEARAKKNGS